MGLVSSYEDVENGILAVKWRDGYKSGYEICVKCLDGMWRIWCNVPSEKMRDEIVESFRKMIVNKFD